MSDDGEDTPSTDIKIKKTPISKEDKNFLEFVKRYFSSISARRAPCVYFNLFEDKNTVLLSNTDGELLCNFCPGELSFHVIKFKPTDSNIDYLNRLKTYLMVVDDKIEIRNVCTWLSWVNKYGLDQVAIWQCGINDVTIISDLESVDQAYEKKQIMGKVLKDFNIQMVLNTWMEYVTKLNENKHPHIFVDINRIPTMEGCVIFEPLDISKFNDNEDICYDDYHELHVISFDGLSSPALKEFITKTDTAYTYMRKVWAETKDFFRSLTLFEDENVIITTIRPNAGMFPMPKKPSNTEE